MQEGIPLQGTRRRRFRDGAVAIGNSSNIAIRTLWVHKLRSVLTVFGIVIGIAAVVLIGATLEVVRDLAAESTAQTIGANTFIIAQVASPGSLSRKELSEKLRRNPEIYRREAEALATRVTASAILAPALEEIADVKAGNNTFLAASIIGATENIQIIRNIRLGGGRFFTETENKRSLRVAVIGHDLVKELFPSRDPLGKRVRIKGQPFLVIGTLEKKGSSFGSSLDRIAYIPLMAFEKIWGSRRSVTVYAQPQSPELLEEAQERTGIALRTLRRLRPGAPDNFDLLVPEAGRGFLARVVGAIAIAIVPISSVALIVAGIVVMNMMLVSVTERTREIGIRKSLGARNRDILSEILLESTLLSFMGGAAGLLISYLGTIGLSRAFGTNVSIPLSYALLALGTAAAIGVGAGFYPAYLASRMPPVEALRYET